MLENIKAYKYKYKYLDKKEEYKIDEVIGKQLIIHLQDFFYKSKKNKTIKNRNMKKKNKTKRIY